MNLVDQIIRLRPPDLFLTSGSPSKPLGTKTPIKRRKTRPPASPSGNHARSARADAVLNSTT